VIAGLSRILNHWPTGQWQPYLSAPSQRGLVIRHPWTGTARLQPDSLIQFSGIGMRTAWVLLACGECFSRYTDLKESKRYFSRYPINDSIHDTIFDIRYPIFSRYPICDTFTRLQEVLLWNH